MDDEKLILLVQVNDCIYNKYSPGYKLADKKKNVWKQISDEMQVPVEICMKRWACLRDRYAREKRQENIPSGSGSQSRQQWSLMQTMDFIAPHIVPRATRCSYNIVEENLFSDAIEIDPELSPLSEPPDSPVSFSTQLPKQPLQTPTISVALKRKRNKPESDEDYSFSEALGAFKKLCENKVQKGNDDKNPLHGFGKMIVATIGSMNSVKQIKAMQRVTSLVMEIKLEPDD